LNAIHRRFALVVALVIVPIVIYWQSMASIAAQWSSDSYRHGYVIPFVSVILLWRDRACYCTVVPTGSWIGAGVLVLLVALWLVARATSVQTIEHLSVVLMVSAFALTVLGPSAHRLIWFPLVFLVFMVPVGDSAVPRLMDSTASIAVAALQAAGVPALREGMLVSLPGGTFEVVEACSGYNYLNAGVALGVLVAHLMFSAPWKQIIYVITVVGAFIVVNGVRAFIIMFVGSTTDMHFLVSKDHVFFGWVLFLVAMVLMYCVAERFSDVRRMEGPRVVE
jgi:exosortase A